MRWKVALLGLLLGPSPSQSAVRHVPSEYPTIQAGVDAAAFGDTVLVAPGLYADDEVRELSSTIRACVFLKDGVILRSEGGSALTTIHLQDDTTPAHVLYGHWFSLPSTTTSVDGFTLTSVSTAAATSHRRRA